MGSIVESAIDTGKKALNNSFGFGGKCASQLIEIF